MGATWNRCILCWPCTKTLSLLTFLDAPHTQDPCQRYIQAIPQPLPPTNNIRGRPNPAGRRCHPPGPTQQSPTTCPTKTPAHTHPRQTHSHAGEPPTSEGGSPVSEDAPYCNPVYRYHGSEGGQRPTTSAPTTHPPQQPTANHHRGTRERSNSPNEPRTH